MKVTCPICHYSQSIGCSTFPLPSNNPIFSDCKISSCCVCKSAWVVNPPSSPDLKQFYHSAYSGMPFFNFLKKPSMLLERCQAFARWNFVEGAMKDSSEKIHRNSFSVCDIGAGYGCTYEVGMAKGHSLDYFAYESSPNMCRSIQSLGGTVLRDVFDGALDQQYDLVWASHILEHYPNPDILLQRIKQKMKPSGYGFIEIPCLDFEYKNDLTAHLLFFSLDGLRASLNRNGFKIIKVETVGLLREEAKKVYDSEKSQPVRSFVRGYIPNFALEAGRFLKNIVQSLLSKKNVDVFEDLNNQDVFSQWALEVYGGDRCWIRAVFTH